MRKLIFAACRKTLCDLKLSAAGSEQGEAFHCGGINHSRGGETYRFACSIPARGFFGDPDDIAGIDPVGVLDPAQPGELDVLERVSQVFSGDGP